MSPSIVTGQQIGLLGGPLYTPYKVFGAVALAREVGGRAVYWLETNDADFEEINHIDFMDSSGRLKSLRWEMKTGGECTGSVTVDKALCAMLDLYFSQLPPTEYTEGLRRLALDAYREGRTLGEASEALARAVYAGLPLEFFRPDTDEFRAFSKPFLLREAEVTPEGNQANCFLRDTRSGRAIRRAIFRKAGGFATREGETIDLAGFDLLPNVQTRSVIQDAWFKTHTYIAGPGEIAYLKDMGPQYARHGVAPSAVMARMSAVIVDSRDRKLLARCAQTLESVLTLPRSILLKKTLSQAAHFDFDGTEKKLRQIKENAVAAVAELGLETPPVERPLYEGVREVLGRRRAAEKKRHEEILGAAMELSDRLHPGGKPQERVFTLFDFMNRHGGPGLVGQLFARHSFDQKLLEFP